jgi:hypothetical protein
VLSVQSALSGRGQVSTGREPEGRPAGLRAGQAGSLTCNHAMSYTGSLWEMSMGVVSVGEVPFRMSYTCKGGREGRAGRAAAVQAGAPPSCDAL